MHQYHEKILNLATRNKFSVENFLKELSDEIQRNFFAKISDEMQREF